MKDFAKLDITSIFTTNNGIEGKDTLSLDYSREIVCENCKHVFRTKLLLGTCPICKVNNIEQWYYDFQDKLVQLKNKNIELWKEFANEIDNFAKKIENFDFSSNTLFITTAIREVLEDWRNSALSIWMLDVDGLCLSIQNEKKLYAKEGSKNDANSKPTKL